MAITITQAPSLPFDMGYGANPITLNGINTITPLPDKYALRIYIVGQADPIADIRQSPNRFARAIFDVQNILQSQIGPSNYNIDGLNASSIVQTRPLHIANGELVEYQIAHNTETNGELGPTWTTSPTVYTVIAGSKQYNQVPFNPNQYRPTVEEVPQGELCAAGTVMTGYGKPLSDNEWTITDQQTGDEFIQDGFTSPNGIQVQNVYADDQCTKTFYSKVIRQGGQVDPMVQGLEQFEVLQYSGIFLTTSATINNTQSNGGGPNVTPGQGLLVGGNFQTITMGTGPANINVTILPTTTHYYIIPTVWDQCNESEAAWSAQRYNIIEEPCNDYPHIQFAWLNSLGFRDQFTFTKKNEKKINTKRNEFLKEAADYNSSSYSVDIQSRGYTTYSQTITETWSASTEYINDNQVALIESMFKSAQVMVRFSKGEYANQWVPVRLQSSNFTSKNYRKDRLFQYTVNFTFANNIKSQRG